jgi:hypothetical protein
VLESLLLGSIFAPGSGLVRNFNFDSEVAACLAFGGAARKGYGQWLLDA